MLKRIVTTMIASMLFVFPIAFFISQTVVGGDGNDNTVSEQLVAADNNINGGDITQVSTVVTGDPVSGGSSGGNDNGGSGGNSGGNGNDGSGSNSGGSSNDGSGGSSSGSNSDISGGNSGSDPAGGNGGSSGGSGSNSNSGSNSASSGNSQSNSGGSSSGVSGGADPITAGQISDDPANSVVINKISPYTETSTEYGNGNVVLYNMGDNPVNMNQWYMKNITGYVIGMINNEEIAPSGFVAVDVTGLTRDHQGVTLYDSDGNRIDSVTYTGASSHNGLSYARTSTGGNAWKWTT